LILVKKFPIHHNILILIDLFYNFYEKKKEKLAYAELVNYIYEMGNHMKMISLRQIDAKLMSEPPKKRNEFKNQIKFENGYIDIKNVNF